MTPQEQQQVLNTIQILQTLVQGATAQPGGLLNINTVNTAPFQATPPVAPTIAYVNYKAPPLSAFITNADGVGRTAIDPNQLSSVADTQRLMASFAAAGYTVRGYNTIVNPNETYPSADLQRYVVHVLEAPDPIPTGKALQSEFRSGVDPNGNPHPGKWTLRQADKDAGREYFTYDDPQISAFSVVPGTVVAL